MFVPLRAPRDRFAGRFGRRLLTIIAAALSMLTLAQCAPASPAPAAPPAEISVAEAQARRGAGAFMLDVREPDEWREFHLPGSTLIPLDQLRARANELPRDREIVVVCRSGNRSASGRDILRQAGFERVTSMAGGLVQWRAAGYPTVSGP